MFTKMLTPMWVATAAVALGWFAGPTVAAPATEKVTVNVADTRKGDPEAGLKLIAVILAALIFLVWVAVRIGDVTRPSDKVMG